MISPQDLQSISEIASRYGVAMVLLFGSAADLDREARDIDLAVEGLDPARFFKFYGDLLFSLSKPVDVIDLSRDSKFTRLVRQEGIRIYAGPQSSSSG